MHGCVYVCAHIYTERSICTCHTHIQRRDFAHQRENKPWSYIFRPCTCSLCRACHMCMHTRHVNLYVWVHAHMYTHMNATREHTCACIYAYMHTCMHTHIYMHACILTHRHKHHMLTRVHAYANTRHTYISTKIHTSGCNTCVCVCKIMICIICTHAIGARRVLAYMHTCTHVHTYIHTYVRTYISTNTHTHTHVGAIHVCLCLCVCMCVAICYLHDTRISSEAHTRNFSCITYISTHVHTRRRGCNSCVCVQICLPLCTSQLSTYASFCTHTWTNLKRNTCIFIFKCMHPHACMHAHTVHTPKCISKIRDTPGRKLMVLPMSRSLLQGNL